MAKTRMPAFATSLGTAALIAGSMIFAATPATAEEWSDTSLGYKYGTTYREPFNPNDVTKNYLVFNHIGGYKYGTNFFNVNMIMSNGNDSGGTGTGTAGGTSQGAQEAYALWRNTVSFSKVTGKDFKYGIVKDVGVTFGFDFNSKNNGYSSKKRMGVLGPTLMFDVPGTLNVSLFAVKESNAPNNLANSAANTDSRYTYNTYPELDIVAFFPIGDTPFNIQGYFDWNGSKGNLENGQPSKQEILTEVALMLDLGKLMGSAKNTFKVGIEYQYWKNKFGNDNGNPALAGGATAKVPQLRAEYHF
jgi:nucleoside-specific outer membrane channel protein Tsx